MRLVTFRTADGHAHVGVVDGEIIIDLNIWDAPQRRMSRHDHFDMVALIARGEEGLSLARNALAAAPAGLPEGVTFPLSDAVLLAPIYRPRKNIMCMGRNYAEHLAESIRAFNEEPPPTEKPDYANIFTKATTTMNAPFGDIPYDSHLSDEIDWEVELALVIGTSGKNISRESAMPHVFGYMVLNDISARDIQRRHANQYFKGKSLDGTCPTGPWIVTVDEIEDPGNLEITLRVNGVEKQHDRTSSMLFDIPAIIEQMSLGMTLEPGDIIATGTPSGVGMGRTPKEYLRPGDEVECEIEKIGIIRNRVVQQT